MELWQIFQHNPTTGKADFQSQFDANKLTDQQIFDFVQETIRRNPLPEGYAWLFCNEKSKFFIPGIN